ncbi:hypothetical protein Leryth_022188 [Lithospermum erythrorhizon]|nr:hypothetical protein Leryth_022188 [Lithospermum erythrorhizon]
MLNSRISLRSLEILVWLDLWTMSLDFKQQASRDSRLLAPECISTGKSSKRIRYCNLELVATGKKLGYLPEASSHTGLIEWVWDLYGSGEVLSAADGRLNMEFEPKEVERLLIVGLWCAHPDRSLRPSIRQAIQLLHFEATLPRLPLKMPVPV